ncbi:MAG: tripartite tricarboxylate transporter substrate binding protein [Burkholderiales bacterium]
MPECLIVAMIASLFASLAFAQQPPFPAKPIRLIASQAPGGGVDFVCRIVAPKLSESLGQTVIVENRAGANGSVAADITAKAPPDGHVIMLGAVGNLGTNVIFYKPLAYDPLRDLAPITSAVLSGNVLVVHPSVPVRTVKDLIALARARPNALAYGTSGTGGSGHLAGALFRSMTHTQLLHVPYKGGGPAMIDLVAGQVQIGFASQPSAVVFIREGRLRALAVTTAQRSKLFPELPTVAEAGVPGYETHAWYGFVAPAKTPPAIIARLNQELVRILNAPDIAQAIAGQGLDVWTMKPDAFGAYLKSEVDKWTRVIRQVGIGET